MSGLSKGGLFAGTRKYLVEKMSEMTGGSVLVEVLRMEGDGQGVSVPGCGGISTGQSGELSAEDGAQPLNGASLRDGLPWWFSW